MGLGEGPKLFGHSKGHHEINGIKQLLRVFIQPLIGITMTALRTGPVIAAVVFMMFMTTVLTGIYMTAQSGSTTVLDALHCPAVAGQHGSEALSILGSEAAEDVRQT